MNYLSIVTSTFKGVYTYETKEERKEIQKKHPNGKYMVFGAMQKEEAIAFAGVKEVANRRQEVVKDNKKDKETVKVTETNSVEKNSFNSLIEYYKNKGVSAIKLHSNKEVYTIFIKPTYLLKSKLSIMNNINNKYRKNPYFDWYSSETFFSDIKTFISTTSYIDDDDYYCDPKYYTVEEGLSLILSGQDFYTLFPNTKFSCVGQFICFEKIGDISLNTRNGNTDIKLTNQKEFYTININKIDKIEPFNTEWEIKDKDVLSVIKKLTKF